MFNIIVDHGNANQKIHHAEWLRSKIQLTSDDGHSVGKEEDSTIISGIEMTYNILEITLGFPQKIEHRLSHSLAYSQMMPQHITRKHVVLCL